MLQKYGCPAPDTYTCIGDAVKYGSLNILKYIYNPKAKLNPNIFVDAITNGYLHIVKWLDQVDDRYKSLYIPTIFASTDGKLEILKWLVETGYYFEEKK